ncbi:MAG: hypothetical protein HY043_23370 [Verrucomicrobia bacterium]|nr:hypothetical protein [Verrucomicrobiota bacterium]
MERFNEQELAECIARELRQLPPPKAPETLAPRVRAALAARAHQPWWKKSWAHWPFSLRVIFFAASLAIAGGLIYAGLWFTPDVSLAPMQTRLESYFDFLAPIWQIASALGIAFASVVHSGGQLLLWSVGGTVTVMYLTCVGLGTLCYRVALNKI